MAAKSRGLDLAKLNHSIHQQVPVQEAGHIRLGHGLNQHVRELGLGANSVGELLACPMGLKCLPVCIRAEGGFG